jgi:hypothetical protein
VSRARNIKPGFFANELLAEVPPLGRLLFAGLWTIADRDGRLEDRPSKIKAAVLPYDKCAPENLLSALADRGFILRYEVDGRRLIQVVNWKKHQAPHFKEQASTLPAPYEPGADPVQPQGEPEASPAQVPCEPQANPGQAPGKPEACPEHACNLPRLIPGFLDSLIPGSLEEYPPGARRPDSSAAAEVHPARARKHQRQDLDGFDAWFGSYPLRVARGAAEKAWAKLTELERGAALSAVGLYAEAYRGADEGRRQYIPHPATWLNAKRWTDDPSVWRLEAATPKNGNGSRSIAPPSFRSERSGPTSFEDLEHEEV